MNRSNTAITPTPSPTKRWDIFCRVIDNFGDAGVCWRLSQQLATTYQQQVHLWIDDLSALAALSPGVAVNSQQQVVDQIVIHQWVNNNEEIQAPSFADVVVEAFACELPDAYLQSMSQRNPQPCWVNLEYLSAEKWVEDCHGLASPHPILGMKKHFFFPGFSEQTGGLLWGSRPLRRADFLSSLGLEADFAGLTLSFFAYDHMPADSMMKAWQSGPQPIRCLVPPGKPRQLIETALDCPLDQIIQRGQLSLIPIPFLSQPDYDQLLLACDLNFVRGEDSFVRAQWAGKPFIWQIYPQVENAHMDKLQAFLTHYSKDLPHTAKKALIDVHQHWNEGPSVSAPETFNFDWCKMVQVLSALDEHAKTWAEKHHQNPGLAENLVKFSCLSV